VLTSEPFDGKDEGVRKQQKTESPRPVAPIAPDTSADASYAYSAPRVVTGRRYFGLPMSA
jgi:hypothetical protein